MYDHESLEKIVEVYRIKGKDGEWNPAVRIAADHNAGAIWVAALMYNVYSRYLETIDDSEQNEFESDVKETLKYLFKNGMEHIEKMPHAD
jgi:hypothetical protein